MPLSRWFISLALLVLASSPLGAQDELPEELKKLGAKMVADNAFKSSFSPDGKKLVVGRMPVGSGLSIIDLADGKATEISKEGKDPAWQPKKGALIAYVLKNNTEEEIWLTNVAGEQARKLADASFPCWSGDGGTLYCHSRMTKKLLAYDASGGEPKLKEEFDIPFSYYPVVSPDGERVAFQVDEKLQIYDLKAKKLVRSWPVPGWMGLLPAWSPDSKQVAFGTYGHGDGAGFWLLDVPGARVTEIAKGSCTMAAWSPDGKQLAFDLREAKRYRVLLIDAAKLPGK